jgi:NAD(P)-dependent dehydrogenase (short-subunit alcohol dehydrogenase family)
MSDQNEGKVLLITGAGRGMGTDIAKAALASGYKTVATGRNIEKVTEAVWASDHLLVVKLDVTDPGDAQAAVKTTVEKPAGLLDQNPRKTGFLKLVPD